MCTQEGRWGNKPVQAHVYTWTCKQCPLFRELSTFSCRTRGRHILPIGMGCTPVFQAHNRMCHRRAWPCMGIALRGRRSAAQHPLKIHLPVYFCMSSDLTRLVSRHDKILLRAHAWHGRQWQHLRAHHGLQTLGNDPCANPTVFVLQLCAKVSWQL